MDDNYLSFLFNALSKLASDYYKEKEYFFRLLIKIGSENKLF